MGQVPETICDNKHDHSSPRYCIIGAGRLAKHFSHYLTLLNLPYSKWHRKAATYATVTDNTSDHTLSDLISSSTHVLLLISDDAIEPFIKEHFPSGPPSNIKHIVHCSGSLVTPLCSGAHPLLSFSEELFDLAHYKQIPFILETNGPKFNDLLPGLPNPYYEIDRALKPFYHALAVMSGNFSTLLWKKLFDEFKDRFNIPPQASFPYLESIMRNIMAPDGPSLTGPLVRGDTETIESNIKALTTDPFRDVYVAFVSAYNKAELHNEAQNTKAMN